MKIVFTKFFHQIKEILPNIFVWAPRPAKTPEVEIENSQGDSVLVDSVVDLWWGCWSKETEED